MCCWRNHLYNHSVVYSIPALLSGGSKKMKDNLLKKCPLCGNENLIVTNGIVSCTACSFKKAEKNGKTFVQDD